MLASVSGVGGIVLWCAAVFGVLVSLLMGMCFVAGSTSKRNVRKPYLIAAGIALVAHAGYLAAPLAAGTRFWVWAFWGMVPLAAFVLLAMTASAFWPARAMLGRVRAEGDSLRFLVRRTAFLLVFFGAAYILPPTVVWVTRPG